MLVPVMPVLFMMVPVPAIMLDIGFITNIMISLAVLMVALNAAKPLDFSSFPTVLLFATLLRLALNVASTRVVLVSGHEGSDAAGQVIEAFGHFLIGGNYTVGIVVFVILTIINFMVVTKGAGRIAEVGARFTLDAMPGKQMAIDADLNGGLIDADEARARRESIAREAEFYGAMDGASKFVRGDAIAGLIITALNLVGGIAIGAMGGMSMGQAVERYSMLTIGDGLVSQIPALLISTAAGVLVTKDSTESALGDLRDLNEELSKSPLLPKSSTLASAGDHPCGTEAGQAGASREPLWCCF